MTTASSTIRSSDWVAGSSGGNAPLRRALGLREPPPPSFVRVLNWRFNAGCPLPARIIVRRHYFRPAGRRTRRQRGSTPAAGECIRIVVSENRVPWQAVCVGAWLPLTLLPSLVATPNHRTPLTTIPIHSRDQRKPHSATQSCCCAVTGAELPGRPMESMATAFRSRRRIVIITKLTSRFNRKNKTQIQSLDFLFLIAYLWNYVTHLI